MEKTSVDIKNYTKIRTPNLKLETNENSPDGAAADMMLWGILLHQRRLVTLIGHWSKNKLLMKTSQYKAYHYKMRVLADSRISL